MQTVCYNPKRNLAIISKFEYPSECEGLMWTIYKQMVMNQECLRGLEFAKTALFYITAYRKTNSYKQTVIHIDQIRIKYGDGEYLKQQKLAFWEASILLTALAAANSLK